MGAKSDSRSILVNLGLSWLLTILAWWVDFFSPLNIMMDALTVFNKGGSLDMTDEEAIATASIGLKLYTEVPIRSCQISHPMIF